MRFFPKAEILLRKPLSSRYIQKKVIFSFLNIYSTRKRAYLLRLELTSNVNATCAVMNGFEYTLLLLSRIFQKIHSAVFLMKIRTRTCYFNWMCQLASKVLWTDAQMQWLYLTPSHYFYEYFITSNNPCHFFRYIHGKFHYFVSEGTKISHVFKAKSQNLFSVLHVLNESVAYT